MAETLGTRLKRAREKVNKTQGDVCKTLGISIGTLSGYERDYRKPDAEMIAKLADLYEVTADYLIGRVDVPYLRLEKHTTPDGNIIELTPNEHRALHAKERELEKAEREFLKWVEENLESSFFYDFDKSPEDSKKYMMETLRLVWEREKGRRPGQKQGE